MVELLFLMVDGIQIWMNELEMCSVNFCSRRVSIE